MRQRSVSSIAVVLFGIVPTIAGGLVFAIAFTALSLLAFVELATMITIESRAFRYTGFALIVSAGLLAYLLGENEGLPMLITASVVLPLVVAIFIHVTAVLEMWARTLAVTLYLAVPAFAAVSIRELDGGSAGWLATLNGVFIPGGSDSSRGLAWFLLVLIVTWFSDTGSYLVGKRIGRRKLMPRVSPNKTVEGAVGGLGSAALTALLCSWLFELDVTPWLALMLGVVLGAAGILGDLSESMIKRQLGLKDSGTLIPGHGGVLDRIDALLFVVVTAWLLIPSMS